MTKMLIGVFERLFESYKVLVIQGSHGWAIPFRVLLIPVSIFFYALTFLVIVTILPLVICVALPISTISKVKISKARE